jgi:hypothetical protein
VCGNGSDAWSVELFERKINSSNSTSTRGHRGNPGGGLGSLQLADIDDHKTMASMNSNDEIICQFTVTENKDNILISCALPSELN